MNTFRNRLRTIVTTFLVPILCYQLVMTGYVVATLTPSVSFADQVLNSAQEGRAFGNDLWQNQASGADDDANINMQYQYKDNDGNTQNANETIQREQLIQGSSGSWDTWSDAYGDDEEIGNQAQNEKTDAENNNTGARNEGFNTVVTGSERSHPDIAQDPMWANTKATLRALETGANDCPSPGGGSVTTNQCHRNNSVTRCDVSRDVYVSQVSRQIKVMEFHGCFDSARMKFKALLDSPVKKAMQGYFIDRQTNQRYDMNNARKFVEIPDELLRYNAEGTSSREYPYLERAYANDYQGLYGVLPPDVQSLIPEVDYELTSKRGNSDDLLGGAYHFFNPVDKTDFGEDASAIVGFDSITWNLSVSTALTGSSTVTLEQEPEEANGWEAILDLQRSGKKGKPACPMYSIEGHANPANRGPWDGGEWNKVAWGRVTLTANITATVIKERIVEGPKGCRGNISSACESTFSCTDNAARSYDGITDEEVRAELSSLYPGDNPQDTSQPICYEATIDQTCANESGGYDSSQSCSNLQNDPTCSFEKTVQCGAYNNEGRCEYYIDEYTCGHSTEPNGQCDLRDELIDMFPGCTTNTTESSSTSSTFLPEEHQCEQIHELTGSTCTIERTVGTDPEGEPIYTDDEYPSDPENDPCLKRDDGFTTPTWTCNETMAPYQDEEGNEIASPFPPIYPGADRYCVNATAEYDTYFWKRPMNCYEDAYGEIQCPQADEDTVDRNTCDDLEAQGCSYKGTSRCVSGGRSPRNGYCYLEEFDYECGESVTRTTVTNEETYDCSSSTIRCMGNDCFDSRSDPGAADDFAQAASAMQLAEYMANDGSCDADGNCTVFAGEEMYCKKALGGVQNCCENPGGPGLQEYITLLHAAQKGAAALQNIEAIKAAGETVVGAWNELKEPVAKAWDSIASEFFTSGVETATAESGKAAGSATFTDTMANWVGDVFGEAVRDSLFSTGADGSMQLGGGTAYAGSALNFLATAYMYYTIAIMVIQIVWKCEEEEFEYASKRQLRVCHKVGTYCSDDSLGICVEKREVGCCFSSPLPRIINEQARAQLGLPWGGAKNPRCEGLSLSQLEQVKWDQIDLSEWIALLNQTGHMPSTDVDERFSIEEVTGDGNALANGEPRQNTLDRSTERWQGVDEDQVYQDVERDLWGQE